MKLSDLYKADDYVYIPDERMENLRILLEKMNQFEALYQKKLIVTRGYSTISEHKKIYEKINQDRAQKGLDALPIPLNSKHLVGQAVDCYDPDPPKDLRLSIMLHQDWLDKCGLWCEKFDMTPHVHFQSVQYGSWEPGMTRFFRP